MTSTLTTPLDPWADVAEVAAVQAALDAVSRQQAELRAHRAIRPAYETRQQLTVQVAETLIAGRPLPADLARRAADAETPQDPTGAADRLLGETRQHLGFLLEQAKRSGSDQALGYLDSRLHDLLDQVADVDETLGTVTADPAYRWPDRTDLAAAWEQLQHQVAEYQAIRAAQTAIVAQHMTDDGKVSLITYLPEAGLIADALHHDPLRTYIAEGAHVEPSWLADPAAHLRWLTRADVAPWVPTIRQLREKHAHQAGAVAAADLERARARGQAVDVANRYQPHITAVRF